MNTENQNNRIIEAIEEFVQIKKIIYNCISQINEELFFYCAIQNTNSIAILTKHLAGNMSSRWKLFQETDGEKPDRNRKNDFFIDENDTMDKIISDLDFGWKLLFDALEKVKDSNLNEKIFIKGKQITINKTIYHHIMHYSYHCGQIVQIAKTLLADKWKSMC